MLAFDYNKLRGKIKEIFKTQDVFAERMELSRTSLSSRLNNQTGFSQDEILKACDLLDIPVNEMVQYFFTLEVRKHEQ